MGAFGSTYSLLVLTVGDTFGRTYFASNYMLYDGIPAAVGSVCFAKYMAQAVYMKHADTKGKCRGDECFRLAYVCVAGLQVLGSVCAVMFSLRTSRAMYSSSVATASPSLGAEGVPRAAGDGSGESSPRSPAPFSARL